METAARKPGLYARLVLSVLLAGSLLYFAARGLLNCLWRLLGQRVPGTGMVLCYHAVSPAQRQQFAQQMDDLVRWARAVPADFRGPLADGVHHVAVTFDDGYQSIIENALPELRKRGIPSTVFLVTGNLGRRPAWKLRPGSALGGEFIATAEHWGALASDDFALGSHTASHPDLATLDDAAVRTELIESREILEALLDRPVTLLALPYGSYNERTADLCRAAGYERVFTIDPAQAFATPEDFVTGRAVVQPDEARLTYRLKMLGAYDWVPRGQRLKRKLASRLRRRTVGSSE